MAEALDRYDLEYLYDKCDNNYLIPSRYLTAILLQSGIDPLPYLKEIKAEMFLGLPIEEIDVPDNIKSILSRAFVSCIDLYKVRLPKLNTIGYDLFLRCPNLENIVIGLKKDNFNTVVDLPMIFGEGITLMFDDGVIQL